MKNNILDHVDILDLVRVKVFFVPIAKNEVDLHVAIEPLDQTKNVVMDVDAKSQLENAVLEQIKHKKLSITHQNTGKYLTEFASRMIREYHALKLIELEDIKDPKNDDPYFQHRKLERL